MSCLTADSALSLSTLPSPSLPPPLAPSDVANGLFLWEMFVLD